MIPIYLSLGRMSCKPTGAVPVWESSTNEGNLLYGKDQGRGCGHWGQHPSGVAAPPPRHQCNLTGDAGGLALFCGEADVGDYTWHRRPM